MESSWVIYVSKQLVPWIYQINEAKSKRIVPWTYQINKAKSKQLVPWTYHITKVNSKQLVPWTYQINKAKSKQLVRWIYQIHEAKSKRLVQRIEQINKQIFSSKWFLLGSARLPVLTISGLQQLRESKIWRWNDFPKDDFLKRIEKLVRRNCYKRMLADGGWGMIYVSSFFLNMEWSYLSLIYILEMAASRDDD